MNRIARILAPNTVKSFLEDFWNKRWLLAPGAPERFDDLPGIERFFSSFCDQYTDEGWVSGAPTAEACYEDAQGNLKTLVDLPPHLLHQLYNSGMSICFAQIPGPEVQAYANAVREVTDWPGRNLVNAYLTPKGGRNFCHFDCQHVFFLQIAGKKRWRLSSQPAMHNPTVNISVEHLARPELASALQRFEYELQRPEDCDFEEVILSPGDCLYLPPGTWHEPFALETSLHYTLTLAPFNFHHFWRSAYQRLIQQQQALREDLRFIDGGPMTEERLVQALDEQLRLFLSEASKLSGDDLLDRYIERKDTDWDLHF